MPLIGLSACTMFDRRDEVALAVLVNDDGRLDQELLHSALKSKFPPGTNYKDLSEFVDSLGGTCNVSERDSATYWCEITTKAGFCWAHMIGITVIHNSDIISEINTNVGGLSC